MAAITATLAAVAVGSSIYFGKSQMDAASDVRQKQEDLEGDRRRQLATEAAARDAAKARAAERGASAGQRTGARQALTGALGFGSGNTQQGLGSGMLFGN